MSSLISRMLTKKLVFINKFNTVFGKMYSHSGLKSQSTSKYIKFSNFPKKSLSVANFRGQILEEQVKTLLDYERRRTTPNINTMIATIKTNLDQGKIVELELVIKTLSLLDKIDNPIQIEEGENVIIEIIRNENFADAYFKFPDNVKAHDNFSEFFNMIHRIKSFSDEDLEKLVKVCMSLKTPRIQEFSVVQSLKLYDSLYYLRKSYSKEKIDRIFGELINNLTVEFNRHFTSLFHDDIVSFLKMIIFEEDSEIVKFTPKTVERMFYVFDDDFSKKLDITTNRRLILSQFYPKMLYPIKNVNTELYKTETEKLREFLLKMAKCDLDDISDPDLILCNVSNYLVWVDNDEAVLEAYINYIYQNLSGLRNEIVLDLFFLILNCNFFKFSNEAFLVTNVNLIYQLLKTFKPDLMALFDDTKETIFFNKIRKQLIENFDEWDSKNPAIESDHPDHYHKRILREFVKKSIDALPFSSIHYEKEMFDRVFSNLKNNIKF